MTYKIYVDVNYPRKLIDALVLIHSLSGNDKYKVIKWSNQDISDEDASKSILLFLNSPKNELDISIIKHYEEGYRVVVCKTGNEKLNFFEFAMTVLRIWPRLIELFEIELLACIYTFRYRGKKLIKKK